MNNQAGIDIVFHSGVAGTVVTVYSGSDSATRLLNRPSVELATRLSEISGPEAMQTQGAELFETLFGGAPRRILGDRLRRFDYAGAEPLKLRFHWQPQDSAAVDWAALPWELLYCEGRRRFLTHSEMTPIVRAPQFERHKKGYPRPRKWKVLVLAVGLSGSGESRYWLPRLARSWNHELAWVHCQELPSSRSFVNSLDEVLKAWDCHILHLLWRGSMIRQDASLLMACDAFPAPLPVEDLVRSLRKRRRLCLVVHQTLAPPLEAPHDELASGSAWTAALVEAGLRGGLDLGAMHRGQEELVRVFAQRLCHGESAEAATSAARLEVFCQAPESAEWSRPRLFSRTGEVFRGLPELRPWMTTLWTVTGAGLFLFTLFALLRHRSVELPWTLPIFEDVSMEVVTIRAIAFGLPLLFFQIAWTHVYQRGQREPGVRHRLPVAFHAPIAGRRLVATAYQYTFLALFLMIPMAAQLYLFGDSLKRPVFDSETPDKIFAVGLDHLTCFIPLETALARDYRHGRWDGWCRSAQCNSRFLPFWQPWFFLISEVLALAGLLYVLAELLGLTPAEKAYGIWRRAD